MFETLRIGTGWRELDQFLWAHAFSRRRLFRILGWTVAGLLAFAAVAIILGFLYVRLLDVSGGLLAHPVLIVASLLLAFGVFFLVVRFARSTHSDGPAHRVLWPTCVGYALLVSLSLGGLSVSGILGGPPADILSCTGILPFLVLLLGTVAIGIDRKSVV